MKKATIYFLILALLLTPFAYAGPVNSAARYISIIDAGCGLTISSSGLATCTSSATCSMDYSIGIVLRFYRELSNGGTFLTSWTSSILVQYTAVQGTYQLSPTGNWYYAVATVTTYFDGYIRESIDVKSQTAKF